MIRSDSARAIQPNAQFDDIGLFRQQGIRRLREIEVEGTVPLVRHRGNGSRLGTLRDPKSIADYTYAERFQLDITHRELITALQKGDVLMPPGSASAQLMGELTVATGREVALIRIGNQRWLRLGGRDGVVVVDADRVIAHTHPSGELRFSVGPDSDMAVFTNPDLKLTKQKSSVLIAPDGTAVRLPIPR
ncbi:hypothetical protein [Urbifossiella limnaea]|uniref:hypothetical protein n=1 Tax=Urbifossiella limnaea TaxID=2528023 RepID=UPI001EE3C885|nr:hypothetical protein [Urbifossiella limnaea]